MGVVHHLGGAGGHTVKTEYFNVLTALIGMDEFDLALLPYFESVSMYKVNQIASIAIMRRSWMRFVSGNWFCLVSKCLVHLIPY